ncbi:MAG: hypothetical protein PHU91_04450 [Candidatus Omnitrophica bacterium]|nr:hypothetical protein [Candidatus Omnitrophota bacterium]
MKKILPALFLFFIIFSACAPASEQNLAQTIKTGEELGLKWDYRGAVNVYESSLACNPASFELLWKLAYNYIKLGLVAKKDTDKISLYGKAMDYATRAIVVNDARIEGHLWLAVAEGWLALLKGGREKVTLSKNVKAEAEKALKIDPNNDAALHVMGSWNREAATLPGILKMFAKIIYGGLPPSSTEDAVKYLEKAVAVNPKSIEHHLELGKCYMAVNKWDLAKKEWAECSKLTPLDAYDKNFQEEAKMLLGEYKKRR